MKFTILLLTIVFLFTLKLSAQSTYSVSGAVVDTTSSALLVNSSVSILNAKDSTLVKYTRAAKGTANFTINNLSKGKFILLLTYPGYADYVEHFSLDSVKSTRDFGHINLILKARLLHDVIIKANRAAIKIKGDTTEFNAAAFTVQPNAKVEDLLKQLPGIQVDKDGKITAQGQTVNKVLVDGEEFFGDDPTLVTKNIRADMVDKVQLYDKKSDQAAFTGIDDGQKTKTLNIKLKEDKKNGYFGKVDLGLGTNKYYEGQLLFNMFKAKQKFSFYSTISSNGKTGLGWQDSQKYGSSDNVQFGDNGEIFIFGGGGDGLDSFNGQYNGQGLPIARNTGAHYDSKWNKDKESVNANYKIGSLEVDGTSNTLTQNNTPGNIFNSNATQNYNNYMFRQKLDLTYQVKLDTTSNLKISVDGTLKNTHAKSDNTSTSRDSTGTKVNDETRHIDNRDNSQVYNASAFYTKKFKKTGRTLSFLVSGSETQTDSKGFLRSRVDLYNYMNKPDSVQLTDQYKTSNVKDAVFKTNLTYTEPLSKKISAIFNYGFGINDGTSLRQSFNQSTPTIYNVPVDSLNSNYKLNDLSNQIGAIFNYKVKKITLNFGTKVSNVNFNQTDELNGNVFKRNFLNWAPQGNFAYRFSQQSGFELYYNGNTTQPTIDQLQPIPVNTDPLNITVGNPNLTPSFTNQFYVNYNSYKVLSGQSIFGYGNYSFTSNPIVSNQVTDSKGKSVVQYVNLGNRKTSNYQMNVYFDRKISPIDINIGFNGGINGNTSYNFSNSELNLTDSHTYSGQLRISKYKEKKYDFNISAGPNYTISGSSLNPETNDNGRGFNADYGFTVYLPLKFQLSSDGSYLWKGKTETFNTNFDRTLINAAISKTFLKENNLKLSLSVNDLLNQNKGFDRTNTGNYITQNTYTTIQRYVMFSVIWDFNKMGGITKK